MLVVIALVMTVAVYGVVALLVKMDDLGLWMTLRKTGVAQAFGHGACHQIYATAGRDRRDDLHGAVGIGAGLGQGIARQCNGQCRHCGL